MMATPLLHLNVAIGCCQKNLTLCPETAEKSFFSKHAFAEWRFIIYNRKTFKAYIISLCIIFALKKIMIWQVFRCHKARDQ